MGEPVLMPMRRRECIAPDVYSLELGPACPPPAWKPGQWVSLRLATGPHPPLVRAYSLAAPPDGSGVLPLVFDHVEGGLGSTFLLGLRPGDMVEVGDLLGKFTVPNPLEGGILFGARFTGIVPVRCIVRALADLPQPPRVRVVHGARRAAGLAYREELEALARAAPWFSYHPILLEPDPDWCGPVGEETDLLRRLAAEERPYTPMLAGVRAFTAPARALFQDEMGFDRRSVRVESYD